MKYLSEPAKILPVFGKFDVVVAGGGPSGVAAAISAARNGASVLLLEQTGALGGMGTNGLVPSFCPFSHFDEPAIKGIGFEIWQKLVTLGGSDNKLWPYIDPEKLKFLLDDLVIKSGASILFFTLVSGVIKKGKKIRAIVIENKSGRQAVIAKTFVDATGDGDVAFKAGIPFEKGDKQGKMQGVSLEFLVAGIEPKAYKRWLKKYPNNDSKNIFLRKTEAAGKLKKFKDAEHRISGDVFHTDNVRGYNYGHIFGIDGTDTRDLTKAMLRGRQLAKAFMDFARKHIPGMQNAVLAATGTLPGIRETRRFKGAYKLTLDDFVTMRQFKDQIGVYDYPVDVHHTSKSEKDARATLAIMDKYTLSRGKTYGIPFSSMLTIGVPNLLLTGRHISVDRMMHGSTRVMPACMAIGEAAGLAAAMATKKKIDVTKINTDELRKRLAKQGAKVS